MKKGITVAGTLIADVFYFIDTFPKEGFLTNIRSTELNVGGTGNMILDLAKMDSDLTVKICAILGQDERGPQVLSILSEYPNIDTENVMLNGQTPTTLVMNALDTKQRTFFYNAGASDDFNIDSINFEKLDTKIFQLEYLLLLKQVDMPDDEYGTHAARILKTAKDHGMITSIDIVSEQSERAKHIVKSALKYTDICCINESEAEMVTEISLTDENGDIIEGNIRKAIDKIKDFGVSKWIVIHAPKMGFGYSVETGEYVALPSLNLPKDYIKGTNGAGDAYCSGILYGAHEDMSLKASMELARASAACSLSEKNGTDGLRPYKEIMKLAEKYK